MLSLVVLFMLVTRAVYSQEYSFLNDEWKSFPGEFETEKNIFDLTNSERIRAGVAPLVYDSTLRSAARQHSTDMMVKNYFSHTAPDSGLSQPEDRVYACGLTDFVVGENIASNGARGSPDSIAGRFLTQWMNSPGHRANVLRADFTHIGVGIVSRLDSASVDTVIEGKRQKYVSVEIRRYAVQVFSDRVITFSLLEIKTLSVPCLTLHLKLKSERDVMVKTDRWTQKFESRKNSVTIDLKIPLEGAVNLHLGYLENPHTQDYVDFLTCEIHPKNAAPLFKQLENLKFPIIDREINFEEQEVFYLCGAGRVSSDSVPTVYVYVNDDGVLELPIRKNRFEFMLPLNGQLYRIDFALGESKNKSAKHRVWIDGNALFQNGSAKKIFKKGMP